MSIFLSVGDANKEDNRKKAAAVKKTSGGGKNGSLFFVLIFIHQWVGRYGHLIKSDPETILKVFILP